MIFGSVWYLLKKKSIMNFSRNEIGETLTGQQKTAFSLYQEELLNGCILSYNENLDMILKDVIIPKTITELTGYSGSGKTQVCFQFCISVQLPKSYGGYGGEALYISTNRNFAVHRLTELATAFVRQFSEMGLRKNSGIELNERTILKNIHFIKIDSTEKLLACLTTLRQYLLGKNIRLIVIDSISYLLRQMDVTNRIEVISKIFLELRSLADIFSFAILLTNDSTTRVDEGMALVKPSFGDSFYHLVNSRIILSMNSSTFHAKIVKSIMHGPKEVDFVI